MKRLLLPLCLSWLPVISAEVPKPAADQETVEILSDSFAFFAEQKVAIWRGNVRVQDPKLTMACALLTGMMADEGGGIKLSRVVAETNVVIRITESNNVARAQGDRAVYTAEDQTLVLTGKDPMLESESSHLQMWSPYITIDLKNKALKAKAPVRTRIPADSLGTIGVGGLEPKASGSQPARAGEATEIFSDDFEFDSESKVATWRGNVRAKDAQLDLTAGLVTAKLTSAEGKPESRGGNVENIVVETNVVIKITETNGATTTARGDKAVYSPADETLVLTGADPIVDLGARHVQLQSPQITMDSKKGTASAQRPVRTKLPPGALGKIGGGVVSSRQADPQPGVTQENTEITSDDFHFISESNVVVWRGNVRVKDAKSSMACGLLTATLDRERGELKNLEASTNVVMTMIETNGVTTARGDKAVYSAETETLVLTGADPMVDSSAKHIQLWSQRITLDLKNGTARGEHPVRGTISLRALAEVGGGESILKPAERKPANPPK